MAKTLDELIGTVLRTANEPQVEWIESNKNALSIRPEGQSATRYAAIDHRDYNDFIKSMLGYSRIVVRPGTNNTFYNAIQRFPPEFHPLRDNLYARSVEFVRELDVPTPDGPYESLQYGVIEVSVEYSSMPGIRFLTDDEIPAGFNPVNDAWRNESWRYVSYKKEWGLHSRIIPLAVLNFCFEPLLGGAVQTVPEPSTQMEAEATIFLTWLQVPAVLDPDGTPQLPGKLEQNIASVQGRMNQLAFRGCPPQTLVCLAPKQELQNQPDGTLCWDLTYTLLQRGTIDVSGVPKHELTDTPDWTRLLGGTGKYARVFRRGQAQTVSIYQPADFLKLFQIS